MTVTDEAIDAARTALYGHFHSPMLSREALRLALEAAAPFIVAHDA